jgi:hypothetical protein
MSKDLIVTSSSLTSSKNETDETSINIFKSLRTKLSKEEVLLTTDRKQKLSTLDTKSKMIRYLSKEGYQIKQISNILGIRYQHVYNVLHQITKN